MFVKRTPLPAVRPSRKQPAGAVLLLAAIGLMLPVVMLPVGRPSAAIGQEEAPKEKEEKEIPPPEEVWIVTNDAVRLGADFFPGTEGKESVPVILLHMWKRDRRDYSELALYLQAQGHAVLVPDLRGHGSSTQLFADPGSRVYRQLYEMGPSGSPRLNKFGKAFAKQIEKPETLDSRQFMRMVQFDMEAMREFLEKKNNAGELNVEKLCVVGAEMGASVAMTWTRLNWDRAPVGPMGQDVKALVLISPEWSTRGLSMSTAMRKSPQKFALADAGLLAAMRKSPNLFKDHANLDFRKEVSVLIITGKDDSRAVRDAQRLRDMLKIHHPEPSEAERAEKKDLFYGALNTKLQGTRMLGQDLNLEKHIAHFILLRVVNRPFPWVEHRDPYDRG